MGHLLALHVTPATKGGCAVVETLAEAVQDATGESVTLAYVDPVFRLAEAPGLCQRTGRGCRSQARHQLGGGQLPDAKRGFVPLPRRWLVERSFAWMARCRRLAKNHERLPEILAGLHVAASTMPMLHQAATLAPVHNSLYCFIGHRLMGRGS